MIETEIEDPRWRDLDIEGLAERAAAAVLRDHGLDPETCEIALLACDDARIRDLNASFRDKDRATNVLSWPAQDLVRASQAPATPASDVFGEIELGDIAISFDTCAREAEAAAKPLADHATHLIVHGVMHLLGYDHIDDTDATVMENREIAILLSLGQANPYLLD